MDESGRRGRFAKERRAIGVEGGRREAALKLLKKAARRENGSVVVAGTSYGSSRAFVKALVDQGMEFAVEIRPSDTVKLAGAERRIVERAKASDLLSAAEWSDLEIVPPSGKSPVRYSVADLGEVLLTNGKTGRLFAAQTGGIEGLHRGTIIALTSMHSAPLEAVLRCVGWARWIRPLVRRQERSLHKPPSLPNGEGGVKKRYGLTLRYRSNITLARLQDESEASQFGPFGDGPRGVQFGRAKVVNLVELFAGAGGMGLGFLMTGSRKKRFRLVFSGELHPIYVQTLRRNHGWLARGERGNGSRFVPESVEPVDLRGRRALDLVDSAVRRSGGVDVLIGGPPCQGFSSANRNSWSSSNPQNRMVNVFMRYVERLKPRVFLMENVQGIVWTARSGRAEVQPSVADHIVRRMTRAGYMVFPKLLDAVWYGVPQFSFALAW